MIETEPKLKLSLKPSLTHTHTHESLRDYIREEREISQMNRREREEERKRERVEVGEVREAEVKKVEEFGVIVDMGGIGMCLCVCLCLSLTHSQQLDSQHPNNQRALPPLKATGWKSGY